MTTCDPRVLKAAIRFMYTGQYSDHASNSPEIIPPMHFSVQVHALADYYDMPKLKWAAVDRFKTLASIEWPTKEFGIACAMVYNTTHDYACPLREVVLSIVQTNRQALIVHNFGNFKSGLSTVAHFWFDVARNIAGEAEKLTIEANARSNTSKVSATKSRRLKCRACWSTLGWEIQRLTVYNAYCPSCGMRRTLQFV